MSISIKNLEDRVKALENKLLKVGYKETLLFDGDVTTGNISLTDDISKYHLLCLYYYNSGERRGGNGSCLTTVTRIKLDNIDIFNGGDGKSSMSRHLDLKYVNDKLLSIETYDCICHIYKVYGIFIGGGGIVLYTLLLIFYIFYITFVILF